jgi:hypothetical protein
MPKNKEQNWKMSRTNCQGACLVAEAVSKVGWP